MNSKIALGLLVGIGSSFLLPIEAQAAVSDRSMQRSVLQVEVTDLGSRPTSETLIAGNSNSNSNSDSNSNSNSNSNSDSNSNSNSNSNSDSGDDDDDDDDDSGRRSRRSRWW